MLIIYCTGRRIFLFERLGFVLTFFFLCPSSPSCAQIDSVDALLKVVKDNKSESQVFQAYKRLGELTQKKEPQKAAVYYQQALSFPIHLEYSKAFVEVYNSLGELYHNSGKYDSSIFLHREAQRLAQKFNLEDEIAHAHQGIALNYMRQSQEDSARYYLQQALNIWTKTGNTQKQASVFINLGNVNLEETNNSEALNQFIKAEKIYETMGDKTGLSKAQSNIGNIEFILGNYDKAREYANEALQLSILTGNDTGEAYCHKLLGRIFRKKSLPDSALKEYSAANSIYLARGDQRNISETYQNIGNIYFDLGQFRNALRAYENSNRIAGVIANASLLAYTHSGMGFSWYELKAFDRSVAHFDSSMIYGRKVGNRFLVMDAYQIISQIREEQQRYAEALKFHKLYSALNDSLIEEENRQGAADREAKYQSEKKQNQIVLLQKDQQLKDVSIRQSRTIQTAMVVAILLIIAIGLLIINRNRLVNQAKRHMEIEGMRNEIGRDLHDDIGSTLSSINILSQLAIKESSPEATKGYFRRIADQSAKMMESMSDMIWSINPDNDSFQKMLARMKEFAAEIFEPKNIEFNFNNVNATNPTALDVAQRKNLFLIFKEAINNIAKYSDAKLVTIGISHSSGILSLAVEDNGKGFDPATIQYGNGLRNMKTRADEINASFELTSRLGRGTKLTLIIPLT